VDLLHTFVSHRVQPLQQWEMTKWVYPGPSCPDRSFSTELDDAEINADQNSGPSLIPLREGVVNPWVSLLKLIFA
jgi:hypothetical protein